MNVMKMQRKERHDGAFKGPTTYDYPKLDVRKPLSSLEQLKKCLLCICNQDRSARMKIRVRIQCSCTCRMAVASS